MFARPTVGMSLLGLALAASCGDPTDLQPEIRLELIGPDTFWIQDTPVNPGCHYFWELRAVGERGATAELTGGRIMTTLNLSGGDVAFFKSYHWTSETIKPLFGGSKWFAPGDQRESGSYASVARDLPAMRNRVEFDYLVLPGREARVVTQDFYCLR